MYMAHILLLGSTGLEDKERITLSYEKVNSSVNVISEFSKKTGPAS